MIGFKDMGVKGKLMVIVGVFAVGMLIFGALAFTTLNSVEIGSNLFGAVEDAQGLVADLAPPSLTLMPAELLLTRAALAGNRDKAQEYVTEFAAAKKTFEERKQFWLSHMPDGELKIL